MLTTKQFAERMQINYRTALNWLDAGIVPNAEKKETPFGAYWEIPSTALNMERPKPGPVPKPKTDAKPKRTGKKASKA